MVKLNYKPIHNGPGPWSVSELHRMTEAGFQRHLGIRLVAAEPTRVVLELALDVRHANSTGLVHGGVLMALADSAGAMGALLNLPTNAITTTVESQTHFLRPVRSTRLLAEAEPLHLGRTRSVWRTRILSGSDRRLCAEVTQTQIILKPNEGSDGQH